MPAPTKWIISDHASYEFYASAYGPGLNFNDRTRSTALADGGYMFRDVSPPSTSPPFSPGTYKRCARCFTFDRVSGTYTARAIFSLPRLEEVTSFYSFDATTIGNILTHFSLSPSGDGVLAIYVVWLGWRITGTDIGGTPRYPKTYPLPGDSNSIGIALAAYFKNYG